MTGILSGISGHFSQRVVLGTLLPVVVFVFASQAFIGILSPLDWELFPAVRQADTGWRLAGDLAVTLVLTGFLYALNVPIIRLFEGYPWKDGLIGRWRTRLQLRQLREAENRERFLKRLRSALRHHDNKDPRIGKLRLEQDQASRLILDAFPKQNSVLPTRLGNTIRSFENYPERQYGMSGIDLWIRLLAKIPSDFAVIIDSAKTSFDFMINGAFLSATFALLLLVDGVVHPGNAFHPATRFSAIFFSLLLSFLFYRWSIARAAAWGVTIKSAFDLYRLDLLEELGFEGRPPGRFEERALWRKISLQIAYGDPPNPKHLLRYSAPPKEEKPNRFRLEVNLP